MARKLHSSGYYLEERKKGDVTLLVVSEKVRKIVCTNVRMCVYVYYDLLPVPYS